MLEKNKITNKINTRLQGHLNSTLAPFPLQMALEASLATDIDLWKFLQHSIYSNNLYILPEQNVQSIPAWISPSRNHNGYYLCTKYPQSDCKCNSSLDSESSISVWQASTKLNSRPLSFRLIWHSRVPSCPSTPNTRPSLMHRWQAPLTTSVEPRHAWHEVCYARQDILWKILEFLRKNENIFITILYCKVNCVSQAVLSWYFTLTKGPGSGFFFLLFW